MNGAAIEAAADEPGEMIEAESVHEAAPSCLHDRRDKANGSTVQQQPLDSSLPKRRFRTSPAPSTRTACQHRRCRGRQVQCAATRSGGAPGHTSERGTSRRDAYSTML